jgi:hypothetical protein
MASMRDSLMANCYGIIAESGKRKSLLLKVFLMLPHALMTNCHGDNPHKERRPGDA